MELLHRIQWPGDYERADQSNAFKSNPKHTIKGYYTFPFPHPQNTSSAEDVSAAFCFLSLALPISKFISTLCKTMSSIFISSLKTEQQQKYRSCIHMPLLPQCHFTITLLSSRLIGSPLGICVNLLSPLAQWGRMECGKCKCTVVELSWVKYQAQLHCHMLCEFAASVHMALCG